MCSVPVFLFLFVEVTMIRDVSCSVPELPVSELPIDSDGRRINPLVRFSRCDRFVSVHAQLDFRSACDVVRPRIRCGDA